MFGRYIVRPALRGILVLPLAILASCGDGDANALREQARNDVGQSPDRKIHAGMGDLFEGGLLVAGSASSSIQGEAGLRFSDDVNRQEKSPVSRVLKPEPQGFSLDSAEFRRLYGPGVFNMNALANTVVGVTSNRYHIVSKRFMATGSGHLSYVRLYFPVGSGYSHGHGGTIRLRLFPDDGRGAHLPDLKAPVMAETTFKPMLRSDPEGNNSPGGIIREIRLSGILPLKAGKLYHLLLDNIDPSPAWNFISTNNTVTTKGNGRPGRWLNTRDWAVLMATRPTAASPRNDWVNLTEKGSSNNFFSPILEIGLSSGHVQGNGDLETGAVDPQRVYTATAEKPVRERFIPSKDKRISGLSFATAASLAGSLQWRILQGNTLLAGGVVNQPAPNYKPLTMNTGLKVANMVWYDLALPRDVLMKAGQSYDVEFRPQGRSQWRFAAHQNGRNHGFKWPAAFTESQAQHFHSGRWIKTSYRNYAQEGGGTNWPIVLHLAP